MSRFSILVFVDLAFEVLKAMGSSGIDKFSILVFVDLAFEDYDSPSGKIVVFVFQSLFSWI